MRHITSALLSMLILATAAHATPAPTPNLRLSFNLVRDDDYTGATPVTYWGGSAHMEPALDNSLISYTLYRPGGILASTKDGYGGFDYPSVDAMITGLSAPWTLNITTELGTSQYSLTPDLSVIPSSAYVHATVVTPQVHQVLSTNPTFNWATSLPYTYGYAIADWGPNSIYGYLGNGLSPQSWTPVTSLLPGDSTFALHLYGVTSDSFPFTATLLSGVDQGPITSSMAYEYQNFTPYTVAVPEPTLACVAAPLALVSLLRRNRRHA